MLTASLVLIGLMLAATVLLVVAMCVSAARGDRDMERMIAEALAQPGAEVLPFTPPASAVAQDDAASA